MKRILIAILAIGMHTAYAQDLDTSEAKSTPAATTGSPLTISGYLEAYYSYDFNKPADHNRPFFVYSYNRHNEVNLNLGLIKAAYSTGRVRANMSLMAGTYANANLAAEPGVLKNVFEANGGVKLFRTANLWVDAGIMPSHIGFESAIGKDCWPLTRSIIADNSPYYESGVKLGYNSPSQKWYLAAMYLNGWQRIQRVDGNQTPGFGTQITFKPSGKVTLNSSTFVGNDKPDSSRRMRYFHNLYGIFQITKKLGLTLDVDFGAEQKSKKSSDYNSWLGLAAIIRFQPSSKTALAARAEYYSDENGVIIATGTPNGFKTSGFSLNFDYYISDNVLFRVEGKIFTSEDNIFNDKGTPTGTNRVATTSLAISL